MDGEDSDSHEDGSRSSESSIDEEEDELNTSLRDIKENRPSTKYFYANGDVIPNMSDEWWEELGHDVSKNTHLESVGIRRRPQ